MGWCRTTSEEELPLLCALVNGMTYSIPEARYFLPLIDEPWPLTGQYELGVCFSENFILEIAGIGTDIYHTLCVVERTPCFATPFRPFDTDGTKESEVILNPGVDEPAFVQIIIHTMPPNASIHNSIILDNSIPSYLCILSHHIRCFYSIIFCTREFIKGDYFNEGEIKRIPPRRWTLYQEGNP